MADDARIPMERDSLAIPALMTSFAVAAIASGLDRKQAAALFDELGGLPIPESTEQAFSQLELAIQLVKNKKKVADE